MKLSPLILCTFIILTSCSYKVVRTGYKSSSKKNTDCSIVIKKRAHISEEEATLLGEARLKDSGFTTKCGEATALLKLKEEACSIGADLINITAEKGANMSSICYRCEAKFYKIKRNLNDSSYVTSNHSGFEGAYYNDDALRKNQALEKKKTTGTLIGILIGSIAGGLVAGFLIGN